MQNIGLLRDSIYKQLLVHNWTKLCTPYTRISIKNLEALQKHKPHNDNNKEKRNTHSIHNW